MAQAVAVRETNSDPLVVPISSALNGAFGLYVTPTLNGTLAGKYYTVSRWLRLPAAGTYTFRLGTHQTATLSVRGEQVTAAVQGVNGSGTIAIEAPEVVRVDAQYEVSADGTENFIVFDVLDPQDDLLEVSRAEGSVGSIADTAEDLLPDSELGLKPSLIEDIRFTYPLWTPRPNWRNSISEMHYWLTDVLTSETAAEQRRRLRPNPRRSVEASFTRDDIDANILLNAVAGMGYAPILLPIWWDAVRIGQDLQGGVTDIIPGDFKGREFNVGDLAAIRRDEAFDYELVYVVGVQDTQIMLSEPVQLDTPKGTVIVPVVDAQVRDTVAVQSLTDTVATSRVRFFQIRPYKHSGNFPSVVYEESGLPVIDPKFNWAVSPENQYRRNVFVNDNETGIPDIYDPTNQASTNVRQAYQLITRDEHTAFLDLLFAMQGRWRTFHLPTKRGDFDLVADINPVQGALLVKRCGYTQYGGADQSIMRYIRIEKYDGTVIFNTIISSRIISGVEWLYLAETIGYHNMHDIKQICYMPVARLDIDNIEIERLTDSKSVVSLTFKTFDDRRS